VGGGVALRVGFYDHIAYEGSVRIRSAVIYSPFRSMSSPYGAYDLHTPSDISVILTHLDTALSLTIRA